MRWWPRILITSLFTAGVAFLLSFLPGIDARNSGPAEDLRVFGGTQALLVDDRTIVDFMLRVPLTLHITKVDVGQSVLSVDLQGGEGQILPDAVYRDLYELAVAGFNETSNVQQILVRVLDGQQLLVAMNAKREAMYNVKEDNDTAMAPNQFISSRFQLTYTQRWDKLFQPQNE